MKELEVSGLLDIYGMLLGEKQRNLLELYYNEDLSLSEIAELKGITRQGASDGIIRARKKLDRMDAALRLSARLRAIDAAVSQLRAVAGKVDAALAQELKTIALEIEEQL